MKLTPEFTRAVENISDRLDHLADLGSPDKIAAFLKSKKISGKCKDSQNCPIYKYLLRAAGGYSFKVTTYQTYIWPDGEEMERISLSHPLAVAEFIAEFDVHRFQELEAKR